MHWSWVRFPWLAHKFYTKIILQFINCSCIIKVFDFNYTQTIIICQKLIFLILKYLQGFAITKCTVCYVAPHLFCRLVTYLGGRCLIVACHKEAGTVSSSERLYFRLNLIIYYTFEHNQYDLIIIFTLALFGSFCGGKKNNKKIDKLKNFQYILKIFKFVNFLIYGIIKIWIFS